MTAGHARLGSDPKHGPNGRGYLLVMINKDSHVRRWGAVYVLLLLFIGSWLGQFFAQLSEFKGEQEEHGQSFAWADYWPTFLSATFENWQSEWFQLVFQAILLLGAKHWIFRVDAEDMERIEAKIDQIQDQLGMPTPPPEKQEHA